MSLYKQLWLSIILLMCLSFIGSFYVSNLSAKLYLEEQLHLKNLDNASSLALSITSGDYDDVMLELYIAAQYDAGHYQYIRLNDPSGELMIERLNANPIDTAPSWLIKLFPIAAAPGVAQASSGWNQLGTLTLQSDAAFAYTALWKNTQRLLIYFVGAALLSGLIGSILLKFITKPLDDTVEQAQAIGERRFITQSEPRTTEFRAVVRAMNQLSGRVKLLLEKESRKLDAWRRQSQQDKVTGLMTREPFMARLKSTLSREDAYSSGVLVIFRIEHLSELNRSLGRKETDAVLKSMGDTFKQQTQEYKGSFAGHINGSDFAFLAPLHASPENLGRETRELLLSQIYQLAPDEEIRLPTAACVYQNQDTISDLLGQIDSALSTAEQSDEHCVQVSSDIKSMHKINDLKHWHTLLDKALAHRSFKLQFYQVQDRSKQILHHESPVRLLQKSGAHLNAGKFLPWLSRLGWNVKLDPIVVKLALEHISQTSQALSVNLSSQVLEDESTIMQIGSLLRYSPEDAKKLWIEVPESGVYEHLEGFKSLCHVAHDNKTKIGVKHVGPKLSRIGDLHDLGINYVKVDASFIHDVDSNICNQIFLRGLCTIVHSIGLIAIAEGVANEKEWESLRELGIDGGTGPFFG